MPKIKAIQHRSSIARTLGGRDARASDFDTSGGIRALGGALGQAADVAIDIGTQQQITDAQSRIADAELAMSNDLKDMAAATERGDRTLVERFKTSIDTRIQSIGDGITFRGAQTYLDRHAGQLKASMLQAATRKQAELAGIWAVEDFQHSVNASAETLLNNPELMPNQLARAFEDLDARQASGVLPADVVADLKAKTGASMASAAISSYIDRRQFGAAQALLSNDEIAQHLGIGAQATLRGQIEQGRRAAASEAARQAKEERLFAKAEVQLAWQDAMAETRLRGVRSTMVTDDMIRKGYSDNPAQAAKMIDQLNNEADVKAISDALAIGDETADAQLLEALERDIGGMNTAQLVGNLQDFKQQAAREAREAESERNAARAEALDQLQIGLEPTIVALSSGQGDPGFVSQQMIDAAYPEWETVESQAKRREQVMERIADAKAFFYQSKAVPSLAPGGEAQFLADIEAGVGTSLNATDRARFLQTARKLVADKREGLKTDPFSTVMSGSPELQKLFQQAADDPEMFAQALSAADQLMAGQGVEDWRRNYLGTARAQEVVARSEGMPPEQVADMMEGLAGQYGALWPNVVSELEKNGLDSKYAVLARMDTIRQAGARVKLAQALRTPRSDFKASLGDQMTDIDEAVVSAMGPLRASFGGAGTGGATILAGEQRAAQHLAYQLATDSLGVASPSEVAQKAVDALVNAKYDVTENDAVRVRAPVGKGGLAVDVGTDFMDVLLDPTLIGFQQFPGDAEAPTRRQIQMWRYARRGNWVTSPNGKGMTLLYPNGQPVVDTSGNRIQIGWDQLEGYRSVIDARREQSLEAFQRGEGDGTDAFFFDEKLRELERQADEWERSR